MRKFLFLWISAALFLPLPLLANGKSSAGGGRKQMISVTAMALTSSTKQGGEGPSGSTLLTQSEYIYGWNTFGLGMFFNYDMQGSAQKDSAYGPKAEVYLDPFYLELGYAVVAKRAYTDRTIAEQSGTGLFTGLGVRLSLGASKGAGGGWFFQAAYKMRTVTITKQDGSALSENIIQQDTYPLVGLGFKF